MSYLDTHGLTTLWNKIKTYISNYHDTTKQNTLVSGTNIKTVNSNSLLGSGNVSVGTYSKPSGGIPKTDLASAVQTSLGKADTALQSAPVTSVNSKTGAVSLSASDVGAAATTHSHTDPQISWGGSSLSGTISPNDMGCIDEFGHNKLSFLPPECINVAYSINGGTTWVDYGLTDAQKIALVTTTGPTISISKGAAPTSSNITNLKVRVRISAQTTSGSQKIYTSTRKWLINISTSGASGCTVTIRKRTIANHMSGTETWTTVGTYPVSGWSGWNSIPFQDSFGGSTSSQTSQTGEIEFVFGATGIPSPSYGGLSVKDFRLIGTTNWTMPSELARAGHLYTIDASQNATFPAGVSATTFTENGATLANKYAPKTHTHTKSQITDFPTLATVATSGSYNDLSNKPTIPSAITSEITEWINGTANGPQLKNSSTNVLIFESIPRATNNNSGVVNTIDQEFSGQKSFNDGISFKFANNKMVLERRDNGNLTLSLTNN